MRKIFALMLAVGIMFTLAACAAPTASEPAAADDAAVEPAAADADADPYDAMIGIAMPTHSDESWLRHTNFLRGYLEEMGYKNFDEQWAEDVVADQVSQIENLISKSGHYSRKPVGYFINVPKRTYFV